MDTRRLTSWEEVETEIARMITEGSIDTPTLIRIFGNDPVTGS